MKIHPSFSKVAKIIVLSGVVITITWQARNQKSVEHPKETMLKTFKSGIVPKDWPAHRKAQIKGYTFRQSPSRFSLSKAFLSPKDFKQIKADELAQKDQDKLSSSKS